MKRILATALFTFLFLPLFATTIVVYYNRQRVILAADSKITTVNLRGKTGTYDTVYGTGNKIFHSNTSYFGVAGYSPITFNVYRVMDSTLKKNTNIHAAVVALKQKIQADLRAELLQQLRHKPDFFKKNVPNFTGSILSVAIVGQAGGQPFFYILNFSLTNIAQMVISVQEVSAEQNTAEQCYILGQSNAAIQYLRTHQYVQNPVSYVETLIRVQMAATPLTVGLPIRLYDLSAFGVKSYTLQ